MTTGLRVPHYECEDCWYSCPKSTEGTCNDVKGPECDCGAEKYNAYIEALEAIAVRVAENDLLGADLSVRDIHAMADEARRRGWATTAKRLAQAADSLRYDENHGPWWTDTEA